jgi:hypothetical protein
MPVKSQSSQKFVPVREVRDGILIMKDGSMRLILIASSLNFALKSEGEQAAILSQFQNFLNSLDYSIQIVVQSRHLDIRPYLASLQERMKTEMNDLMRIQIQEYIDFIKNVTDQTNIMTKMFFLVVPYTPKASFVPKSTTGGIGGIFDQFLGGKKGAAKKAPQPQKKEEKREFDVQAFEEARSQLEQRANVVRQGLARTGIRVVPLGTEEVIELFYKFLNPPEVVDPIKKME